MSVSNIDGHAPSSGSAAKDKGYFPAETALINPFLIVIRNRFGFQPSIGLAGSARSRHASSMLLDSKKD
jgi:hypothetical protein